ncbi:MAG: hypothetical protein HPY57_13225 [Ignavibacteria bacterium]|nr:hypothetical protein [Ignavibacteria bacterium]
MINEFKEYQDLLAEIVAANDNDKLQEEFDLVKNNAVNRAINIAKMLDAKFIDKHIEMIKEKIEELSQEMSKLENTKKFFKNQLARFVSIYAGRFMEIEVNGLKKYVVVSKSVRRKVKEEYIDLLREEGNVGNYTIKLTADEFRKVIEVFPELKEKANYNVGVEELAKNNKEEAIETIEEPTVKIVKTKPKNIDNEDINL